MFVWNKRLIGIILGLFVLLLCIFLFDATSNGTSGLKIHTTRWIVLNYIGLIVWVFVWMLDQTRMRGKKIWGWLIPFFVAPLPTLMVLLLLLQRRTRST